MPAIATPPLRPPYLKALYFGIWLMLLMAGCTGLGNPTTDSERRASITANPNPVEEGTGLGTTTITWNTGDGTVGQVNVSANGQDELIFAQGPSGTIEVPWIQNGWRYTFTLYTLKQKVALASVSVTRGQPLNIPVDGKPIWLLLFIPIASISILLLGQWLAIRKGVEKRFSQWMKAVTVVITGFVMVSIAGVGARALQVQTPDSREYADGAQQLILGNGYVTTYHFGTAENKPGLLPATHPPGFSLALIPFVVLSPDVETGAQVGSKFYVMLYVVLSVAVAWLYGGPLAGAIVSILMAVSSFVYVSASHVLSDSFAAMLMVAIPLLLKKCTRWQIVAIGLLAGFSVWVRFSTVFAIAAAFLAVPSQYRKRLIIYGAFPILALFIYQWATFGNPLLSGLNYYLPDQHMFDLSHAYNRSLLHDGTVLSGDNFQNRIVEWVCQCTEQWPRSPLPNIVFYPLLILGFVWVYAPPLAVLPGFVYIWQHRQEPAERFTLWLLLMNGVFFLFFFAQERRYIAGPMALLTAFSAVAVVQWMKQQAEATHVANRVLPQPVSS